MDRDQAEALRRERIAEHRIDARADPPAAARDLAQHQIAGLAVRDVADGQLAALLLLDRSQPEARALLPEDAEHKLLPPLELLQRMRDELVAALLGAREDAVADAERATPLPLDDPQLRRGRVGFPLLGRAEDVAAVVGFDDPQHRHARHAPGLVERPCPPGLDQPLVGHVVEQPLERDLGVAADAERSCDLALARRLVRRRDEVENLLSAREVGGALAGHRVL